jgi:hypothetical protein
MNVSKRKEIKGGSGKRPGNTAPGTVEAVSLVSCKNTFITTSCSTEGGGGGGDISCFPHNNRRRRS